MCSLAACSSASQIIRASTMAHRHRFIRHDDHDSVPRDRQTISKPNGDEICSGCDRRASRDRVFIKPKQNYETGTTRGLRNANHVIPEAAASGLQYLLDGTLEIVDDTLTAIH